MREPVYVYGRHGRIPQLYVAPLAQFADDDVQRVPSLLDALAEFRAERIGAGERERTAHRRRALLKRLDTRERKLRSELDSVESKFQKARDRERLREEGEAIYATLHEVDDAEATSDAKDRATALFAQYKKLGASLPHLEERERALRAHIDGIEQLRWETERAQDADLDDVEQAIVGLDPRAQQAAKVVRRRKRAPLEVRTATGSRILIGRSPSENAELTFQVARPHDLWFHAQRVPGAHVILQRDDRGAPSDDDITLAAALAARHSKAQASASVAVDYTMRKHVRKQKDAPPGLVWYTNFKTVIAAPDDGPPASGT
jgi:predicted ribosome quality control (RQC) complex YloA/Tae2 family protein